MTTYFPSDEIAVPPNAVVAGAGELDVFQLSEVTGLGELLPVPVVQFKGFALQGASALAQPVTLPVDVSKVGVQPFRAFVESYASDVGQPAVSAALKLIQSTFGEYAYPLNVPSVEPVVVLSVTAYAAPPEVAISGFDEFRLIQPVVDDHANPVKGVVPARTARAATRDEARITKNRIARDSFDFSINVMRMDSFIKSR